MVSFFSCGPNRGLAWARMAISQLQRDTTCRQHPRGRTRAPGAAAAPRVMGPGGRRAAARGLSYPATEEAGQQPPVPVKPADVGGRVPGPARGTHKR